jgi:Cd2+/Zn2+-exporting ATPase
LIAASLCLVFAVAGWLTRGGPASTPVFVLSYVCGGAWATRTAIRELIEGRMSVDLLMIVAAGGAGFLGDWGEGSVLLFLFSMSNALEAYAMYRTTRSIDALIKLRPREASKLVDGQEIVVDVETLEIGDVVRIRPGERFPVDGDLIDGTTHADESTLTGESVPVTKVVGDPVFAGTINGRGSVLVRMTRAVADGTLERIVRMVREAQAEKTDAQKFVESWRGPYVVGVVGLSALVFLGALLIHREGFIDAFYHAMVVLVVASPCAVVVGTPVVLLAAITRAARQGVLVKGGAHLERLAEVDLVAFDKTGTITPGSPRVTDTLPAEGLDELSLLRFTAAVERHSEHHLAEAVLKEATRRGLNVPEATDFESHVGSGVHAIVEGKWVGVGRESLFASHEKSIPDGLVVSADQLRKQGRTALLAVVADEQRSLGGVLGLADMPRPNAREALAALRRSGVGRLVILTGDHEEVARSVASVVGVEEFRSGLLPAEKVGELKRWMNSGLQVAMIGDGVNDAPALATADVGVAMGGAGTDVALEVADVVLMRDDLEALSFAFHLSRRVRKRVRQNLMFGFGMIGVLLVSSFFGLPLWLGVVGHEGSTLLVVLNGLRILGERIP